MSVVFTLKDIPCLSIFVYGVNEERRNGALDVVGFSILSSFENIESYQSDLRGLLTKSTILYDVEGFVGRLISLLPISRMCMI